LFSKFRLEAETAETEAETERKLFVKLKKK